MAEQWRKIHIGTGCHTEHHGLLGSHLCYPKNILITIRRVIINFIWNGREDRGRIHLARWDLILRPRHLGGWDLKYVETFERALRIESLWRGLKSIGMWRDIIQFKYPESADLEHLYQEAWNTKRGGSAISNGFKNCWQDFYSSLRWKFGKWGKILIGMQGIWGKDSLVRCIR